MTKKDYELIASAIKDTKSNLAPHTDYSALVTVAYKLANGFSTDNSRFDTKRFLSACGLEA